MTLSRTAKAAIAAVLFLAPGLVITDAQAALVTYNISGTQTSSVTSTPLVGTFSVGQSIAGSFTLDDSLADSDPGSFYGTFPGALVSVNLTTAGYTASATGGGASFAANNGSPSIFQASSGSGGITDFQGVIGAGASVTGADVGGLPLSYIIIMNFVPSSNDFFILPTTSDSLQVFFGYQNGPGFNEVGFTINSVTIGSSGSGGGGGEGVPAPGALALLGLGLMGLGFRRSRT